MVVAEVTDIVTACPQAEIGRMLRQRSAIPGQCSAGMRHSVSRLSRGRFRCGILVLLRPPVFAKFSSRRPAAALVSAHGRQGDDVFCIHI